MAKRISSQTPKTTLRVLALLRSARILFVSVRQVKRHPRVQRTSMLKKWLRACIGGTFNPQLALLAPLHAVSDGSGGLWVLDGGHRVEACQAAPEFGLQTKLAFTVYGPLLLPPPDADCAALLDALSDRHTLAVSAGIQFQWACMAGDPVALETQGQLARLPRTRVVTTAWSIAQHSGVERLKTVVDFIITVWGDTIDATGAVLSTLEHTDLAALKVRRWVLRQRTPSDWAARAQIRLLRTTGHRAPKQNYLRAQLFGVRDPVAGGAPGGGAPAAGE